MAELVGPRLYSCYNCRNHVSLHDDIVSKAFQRADLVALGGATFEGASITPIGGNLGIHLCSVGDGDNKRGRNGRAFLFSHAMNVVVGPKEDRHLMTGLHTVADVYCCDCREILGWKYERAYEETQKYKEGKYILEKSKIVKENW